ncbi:MAG: SurA N-terminal domain-containing protein, partial [Desulfobacteraceae bacterium]
MGRNILFRVLPTAAVIVMITFAGAGAADVVDRIVAVVNDDIITLRELNEAIKPYMEKIRSASYPEEKRKKIVYNLKKDMLGRMIERKLADQEAEK